MLPKISQQQNQEIESRKRFKVLVPTDMFIVREELEHDFGVDFILEAICNYENPTNFRSYIQLKSTNKYIENNDQTISFNEISKSNINYLLNQPNSIYIVYFVKKNRFMWEWVDTIKNYALKKGIDLNSDNSKKFSYRFSKELNEGAFNDIHQSLINLGMNLHDFFDDSSILNKFRCELIGEDFYIESKDLTQDYNEKKYEKIILNYKDKEDFSFQEAILISMSYYNSYRYNEGLFFVEKSLLKYIDNTQLLSVKACLLCESGIIESSKPKIIMAKDIFTALLESEKSFMNYYNLGNAYSALNYNNQAIAAYQRAVDLKPDFDMAWKNMGTAYYDQQNYTKAEECFDKALKYNPLLPEGLFSKGSLLAKLGKYDEAITYYDRALLNDDFVKLNPSILYWKADILYRQSKLKDALKSIELYILYKQDDLYGMNLKAKIYIHLCHQDRNFILEGKNYIENIIKFLGTPSWLLIQLCILYIELNDLTKANETFENILKNYNITLKIPQLLFIKYYKDEYFRTLLDNLDFYLSFRKMSNIEDFAFIVLDKKVDPQEIFWLPHAIAFCKSVDYSEQINKFNKRNLAHLFVKILNYVEESHMFVIKYLSEKYHLVDINEKSKIITSCIMDIPTIWIKETSRIFSWVCNRNEISLVLSNEALDLALLDFSITRCIKPYLKEFNACWKWSDDD